MNVACQSLPHVVFFLFGPLWRLTLCESTRMVFSHMQSCNTFLGNCFIQFFALQKINQIDVYEIDKLCAFAK